jgi:hypothetical protein
VIRQDEYEKRYQEKRAIFSQWPSEQLLEKLEFGRDLMFCSADYFAPMWIYQVSMRVCKDELDSRFARESTHDIPDRDF